MQIFLNALVGGRFGSMENTVTANVLRRKKLCVR